MIRKIFAKEFKKAFDRLKGQEKTNLAKKIKEIVSSDNLGRYKPLKYGLKGFRRVHVNKSFVIVFRMNEDSNSIYFYRYKHHYKFTNDYPNHSLSHLSSNKKISSAKSKT